MSLKNSESVIISEIKSHIQTFPFDSNVKYCGYQQDISINKPELKPLGNQCYKILLTKNTVKSDIQNIYQIAHELIHQIAPVNKKIINYFEEGFATWFQIDFVRRKLPNERDINNKIYYKSVIEYLQKNDTKYFSAFQDIDLLIKLSGKSIWAIAKEILQLKQNFAEINIVDLKKVTNVENEDLLIRLCSKFYE